MKTILKHICLAALLLCAGVLFNSCLKNTDNNGSVPAGSQDMSVYITDDPGSYDNVFIDIASVSVLTDTCNGYHSNSSCNIWQSLNVVPGLYDLMTLRNGIDTLLANAEIKAGDISLIKINLGASNSIVKNGVSHPLIIADSSVILINVEGKQWCQYESRRYKLSLDFDISRSIVLGHDNQYYLYPSIRVFNINLTGNISGLVYPAAADASITVYNSSDTAHAIPEHSGDFYICGLDPGTYSLTVHGSNGYSDTTLTNITVTANGKADVGVIQLHQ